MNVSIKDLAVNMDLGNNGVEFDIYDSTRNHLGDLRIGKGRIEWCKGRTRKGNGVQKSWQELIKWLEESK